MDAVHLVRTAGRAGLLRPLRPDRYVGAARAIHQYGSTLAGACVSAAALYGRDIAIIDDTGSTTFSRLHERTNALAHALRNHGITEGTTVGILARNHAAFVECCIALAKLGADALLLNTSMAAAQLNDIIVREAATHVLFDEDFEALLASAATRVELISTITCSNWASSHTSAPLPAPSRPARTIILTSGTTGAPKGAARSASTAAPTAIGMLEAIPYRRGERILIAAPLFHAWGFAHIAVACSLGCTMVLQSQFDPQRAIDAIARHRVAVLVAVPIMLRRMLEAAGKPTDTNHNTSALRLVPLSGSAIPSGLAEAFMDEFGDVVYNMYGSTEVGATTVASPADLRAAPGTAGRPPGGVELRIFDAADHSLASGEPGRIFVKSALVFDGYTNGENKPVIAGFMSTGDIGHLDSAGRLFVDGREDDMIVSGGENVYPREVEDLLCTHPDVVEAAVIGVEDTEFGQRLRAYVVARTSTNDQPSLNADAIRSFVREHFTRYKVPRDVVFINELPRNAAGKVVTRDLP